jgi:hypothetical protein
VLYDPSMFNLTQPKVMNLSHASRRRCPPASAKRDLFPLDRPPEEWPSCHDAYEFSWALDKGGLLTGLGGQCSAYHTARHGGVILSVPRVASWAAPEGNSHAYQTKD